MLIRRQTAEGLTVSGIGRVRMGRRSVARTSRLSLTGLLAALAVAGCTGGSATLPPALGSTPPPAASATPAPAASSTPAPAASATPAPTLAPTLYASSSAAPAAAASPALKPVFSLTGSMAKAREHHTATVLSDGRVLIAGGSGDASAELYDPKTGKFSPTGSMTQGRLGQTATRLSDGRVLIAGGDDNSRNSLASAELYDPNTGKFSPTGPMTRARDSHAASLLPDGRVLISGGCLWGPNGCDYTASAELYDPATGKFSPTGAMAGIRLFHTATLLSNGLVLIAGGSDAQATLASAELYDSKTGKFSPTASMTSARWGHTA